MKFDGKFSDTTLQVITNPSLLSFIIASIIIFTLPPIFNRYKASIAGQERHQENVNIYYADLDNDGISEKIRIDQTSVNVVSLLVFKNDKVIDQWNFKGKLFAANQAFCGDIDGDGVKEIFIFTYNDNPRGEGKKVFFHCVNPIKKKVLFLNRHVVDCLPFDKETAGGVYPCGFYDENKDGIKEFYFSVSAGYARQPRSFFVFDPAHDTIYQSSQSYAPLEERFTFDLENSGTPDFIYATTAVGNFDTSAPFSDMYAWLMVFTKNAAFRFTPVKIGDYPSWSTAAPFIENGKNFIVTMNIYLGTESHSCSISLFSSGMRKLKERQFLYSDDWEYPYLYYDTLEKPKYFYLIKRNGSIEKFDKGLDVKERKNIPPVSATMYFPLDIDGDGKDELIFQSDDRDNLIVVRNDFSDYTLLNCAGAGVLRSCSVKLNGADPPELSAPFPDINFLIRYQSNPYFYLRYPLYAGIYAVVFSLIMLIEKGQKHRVELKHAAEKRIAELQLKAIKSQLDPHFTLNIINSIGSLFYKQDKEKADYIFGKYSKLLRSTILNSDKITTTLENELEYVKNYLALEEFRHDNKFTTKVSVEENIDLTMQIPKMLIHTFVENAVKHGLKPLEKVGSLLVAVSHSDSSCTIRIADNGIGRTRAKEISSTSTGKGLAILDQILDLYQSLMNVRITYAFKDIVGENNTAAGTEVLITVPAVQGEW